MCARGAKIVCRRCRTARLIFRSARHSFFCHNVTFLWPLRRLSPLSRSRPLSVPVITFSGPPKLPMSPPARPHVKFYSSPSREVEAKRPSTQGSKMIMSEKYTQTCCKTFLTPFGVVLHQFSTIQSLNSNSYFRHLSPVFHLHPLLWLKHKDPRYRGQK